MALNSQQTNILKTLQPLNHKLLFICLFWLAEKNWFLNGKVQTVCTYSFSWHNSQNSHILTNQSERSEWHWSTSRANPWGGGTKQCMGVPTGGYSGQNQFGELTNFKSTIVSSTYKSSVLNQPLLCWHQCEVPPFSSSDRDIPCLQTCPPPMHVSFCPATSN